MSNSSPEKPRLKNQPSQARETHPELEQRQEPSIPQTNFQGSETSNFSSEEKEPRSNLNQGQVNSTPKINPQHSQFGTAPSQTNKLNTVSAQRQENSPSQRITKGSQPKKASIQISEPRSAQDLCDQLNQLVQETKWDKKDTAEQFVSLIVNPNRQYRLDQKQKQSLAYTIKNCPLKYRAIVHLEIATVNFTRTKELPNLDGIIPQIGSFITEELELEPQIKETLLKTQEEQFLFDWFKKELTPKESNKNAKFQPSSDKSNDITKIAPKRHLASTRKEETSKRINFVRDLITLLLCEGDLSVIPNRLNIILAVFADSNHWRKLTTELPNSAADIQYRVKAVSELFRLPNPATTDAERLLLYGAHAQILVTKQVDDVTNLRNSLRKEKELSHQRQEQIDQLQKQSGQLQAQLADAQQKLEEMQIQLENEKKLYERLVQTSQFEIIQERQMVLNKVRSRIEHELQILERCFTGSPDSFQTNSKIGRQNIEKIRKSIFLREE